MNKNHFASRADSARFHIFLSIYSISSYITGGPEGRSGYLIMVRDKYVVIYIV